MKRFAFIVPEYDPKEIIWIPARSLTEAKNILNEAKKRLPKGLSEIKAKKRAEAKRKAIVRRRNALLETVGKRMFEKKVKNCHPHEPIKPTT